MDYGLWEWWRPRRRGGVGEDFNWRSCALGGPVRGALVTSYRMSITLRIPPTPDLVPRAYNRSARFPMHNYILVILRPPTALVPLQDAYLISHILA